MCTVRTSIDSTRGDVGWIHGREAEALPSFRNLAQPRT